MIWITPKPVHPPPCPAISLKAALAMVSLAKDQPPPARSRDGHFYGGRLPLLASLGRQFEPTGGFQRHEVILDQPPKDVGCDAFVVVPQDIADSRHLRHGISAWRAFKAGGSRRLASEIISRPRSTTQRFRLSDSKASMVTSTISFRIISTASTMSVRRGAGEGDLLKRPGVRPTRWRDARAGGGCASS